MSIPLFLFLCMLVLGAVTAYQSYKLFKLWRQEDGKNLWKFLLIDPSFHSGLTEESKAQRRLVMRWQWAHFLVGAAFLTVFLPESRTFILLVLIAAVGSELFHTDKAWTTSRRILVIAYLVSVAFFFYARMTGVTIPWVARFFD